MRPRNWLAAGRCGEKRKPLQHRRDAGPQGKEPERDPHRRGAGFALCDGGLTISTPTPITARFCEDALRQAGVPKALARRIIAGGWKAANPVDADTDALVAKLRAATALLKRKSINE